MIEKGKHHLWIINSIINMIAKCVFNLIKKITEFDKEIFINSKKSWHENLVLS